MNPPCSIISKNNGGFELYCPTGYGPSASPCGQELFTEDAMNEVYKYSTGIPRMINRVCDKSLMYAFQQQKRLVDDHMVKFISENEMLTAAGCE